MYPKNHFYQRAGFHQYVPAEIKDLNFDLKRAQLYPRRPDLVAQAYEHGPMDHHSTVYLPQKMGFRRWKNPHTGASWSSQATSPVRAGQAVAAKVASTDAKGIPRYARTMGFATRVMGAARLPRWSDHANVGPVAPFRSYGVPPNPSLSSNDLAEMSRQQTQSLNASSMARMGKTQQAMSQINTRLGAIRLGYGGASGVMESASDIATKNVPSYTGKEPAGRAQSADMNVIDTTALDPSSPSTPSTEWWKSPWVIGAGVAAVVGSGWLLLRR